MSFPTNCNGRLISVEKSTGCTLTRASIQAMTPQMFEDQGFKEVYLDSWYGASREARLAGYKENSLMMLLNGRISGLKGALQKQNVQGGPSVILPYVVMQQRRHINMNTWKVVSGTAAPGAGSNGLPAHAQRVVVANSGSIFGTTIPDIHNQFVPGRNLLIEYKDATTSVARSAQYNIQASAAGSVANTANLTLVPNRSEDWWAAASAADKLPWQIGGAGGGDAASGATAIILANAISDYESSGGQAQALNNRSLLTFWLQNSRFVWEYTDEYLAALNAEKTSQFYKKFRTLPLAEQRAQVFMNFEKELLNSFFYGQAINENQTVEGYANLPQVQDPNQPGCTIEYKAHALGVDTMLSACGRITDHQGNKLALDVLAEAGYLMKRSRAADGTSVQVVDFLTSRFEAGKIHDIMVKFFKSKYGVSYERNMALNQSLTFDNQVELQYNTYQLPPELGGYTLAIFWHEYFDDRIASAAAGALNAASADRQRTLWGIDWTDITWGVASGNKVNRQTNEADALYMYVMKINAKHVFMQSMGWTVELQDPNRHLIVKNFSNECPSFVFTACDLAA